MVALITGSKETADVLLRQLNVFLPPSVQVSVYISDDGIDALSNESLLVFSSQALHDEVAERLELPDVPKIIGNRTINYDMLDVLVSIPAGTKVLLVNDVMASAQQVLESLLEIGIDHLDMTLYYPGCDSTTDGFDIAITPGETKYVPRNIARIVDIGSRIFDFRTVAKILTHLRLLEHSSGSFSKMYLEKIIKIARGLAVSKTEIQKLNENLERVIQSYNAGLLMFDRDHKIVVFNDVLKKLLKINKFTVVGNTLNQVIQNKKMLSYLLDDGEEDLFNLTIDGVEYIVSKFKVTDNALTCVSVKSTQIHFLSRAIREDALRKGHIAKYQLDDIVGSSESIEKLKEIIVKLSKTDMNVLIQGESGTGKELVASAIHNYSNRSNAPFLAVNFSALPDDLIESELFGYVEGAFTGAKKGGKVGLFEEANGGTIFLDEIGDISLKVQSRLLRVLEEREIMPIGSNEIKPIDVRIVAATNKNLVQLMSEKKFREDLYYRLKMGYVQLQPLRKRIEDLDELMEHMIQTMTSSKVTFSKQLVARLSNYRWMGNIRELKNMLTYMLAVRSEDHLDVCDLPDASFFQEESHAVADSEVRTIKNEPIEAPVYLSGELGYFLKLIHHFIEKDVTLTRVTLANESVNGPYKRSENQVRRVLSQLVSEELITLSKGRRGIVLTEKGYEWVMKF